TRALQAYVPAGHSSVTLATTVTIHASSPSASPVAVTTLPSGPRSTYERDHPSEGGCQGTHDRHRQVSPAVRRAGIVVGSCARPGGRGARPRGGAAGRGGRGGGRAGRGARAGARPRAGGRGPCRAPPPAAGPRPPRGGPGPAVGRSRPARRG